MLMNQELRYNLVELPDGTRLLSTSPLAFGERLIRTISTRDPLAAEIEAFGRLPETLDPAIADLVLLLNEIPGIITHSSCQGHEKVGDVCASVSLEFEDQRALAVFADLLEFVTDDNWMVELDSPEPILDVALEIDLRAHLNETISCELFLGRVILDRANPLPPPTPEALGAFTRELRKQAAARFQCIPIDPIPSAPRAGVAGKRAARAKV